MKQPFAPVAATIFAALGSMLLMTACSNNPTIVDPGPSGTLYGTVELSYAPGTQPAGNGGVVVAVDSTSVSTTTAADGTWFLDGIPTGYRTIVFSKPGFGPYKVIERQITVATSENLPEVRMGEIPRATVASLNARSVDSLGQPLLVVSGNVSEPGVAEKQQTVFLYVGTADSVSNDPKTHLQLMYVDVAPGATSFRTILSRQYLMTQGFAPGGTVHMAAYVGSYWTSTRYAVPGLTLEYFSSLSTPPQRASAPVP